MVGNLYLCVVLCGMVCTYCIITFFLEGCATRRLGRLEASDADIGPNANITYFVNGNE